MKVILRNVLFGLIWIIVLQEWVKKLVSPFSKFLYPHFGGDSLDDHHGFVVEYKLGKDVDLGFHVGEMKLIFLS